MAEDRDAERHAARQEINRNMAAAAQVSQMRQAVLKGKTFKSRYGEKNMHPLVHPGDVLEIGGATLMEIKPNDLLYFQQDNGFQVRRVVRHSVTGGELSFIVKAEDATTETTLPAAQIIGRVVRIERHGEIIELVRFGGGDIQKQLGPMLGKAANWVQDTIDKISLYFSRRK
ncbi:MAG: hypothetical protein FJX76_07740 [Armatimonadetes bacterium]|nr:hypothetical protein [Armatimonadota bacterium]